MTDAARIAQFKLEQADHPATISRPASWRQLGIDVQLDQYWIIRLLPVGSAARIDVFLREPRLATDTMATRALPEEIADRAIAMLEEQRRQIAGDTGANS